MSIATTISFVKRHKGFATAFTAALAAAFLLPSVFVLPEMVRLVLTSDVLFAVFLAIAWTVILGSARKDIRERAARYDANDVIILVVCLLAVLASLVAIFGLVLDAKDEALDIKETRLALAVLTVMFSWLFLHTVLALHYAHAYYWPKGDKSGGDTGGLEFPGGGQPDYLDFLYFAFVLGATAQTSDVQITGKPIRRLAMLHGTMSFAFNTFLLALTVNVAATLL